MSRKVAYGGVLLAVNIILLLFVNIIPINTIFLLSLASLPISIVIIEWGPISGIAFYLGSIALGFIVMTSKYQWIIYTFIFGIYGLVKYLIERDRSIYIEYILKLIFANIIIFIVYFILKQFVYIPVNLITIVLFEIGFIVYDYFYSRFIYYYNDKLVYIIKLNK